MEKEREQAEALAIIERKKADMRARAQPPAAGVMQGALATLDAPTEGEAYLDRFKPNITEIEEILVDEQIDQEEADDSDVLLAPELVVVRLDEGESAEVAGNELLVNESIEDEQHLASEENVAEEQIGKTAAEDDDSEVNWNQQQEPEDDGWAVGW